MRAATVLLLCFFVAWSVAQTERTVQAPLSVSYSPAIGRTNNYRLFVSGEVQLQAGEQSGIAHFTANVDIEQRWKGEGKRLRCNITLKGGTLRVFSQVGEQSQKLGSTTLTFVTTPNGEVLELTGGGARSLEELTANFDLLATALAALLVPFPETGVKAGDAWQTPHRFGTTIAMTTVQCVDIPTPSAFRPQTIKMRLRYTLPIDLLIDPTLKAQMDFTARYTAESEVLFSPVEGRTLSASGSIKLEVGGRIPPPTLPTEKPPNTEGGQPPSQEQIQQGQPSEGQSQQEQPKQEQPKQEQQPQSQPSPPLPSFSFRLSVDAKFELVPYR